MKNRETSSIGETLIGNSPAMDGVRNMISKAAGINLPVLITGESGTGKELVARDIWLQSDRASKPFVTMNTGAVTEELVMSELFGHVRGAFTGAVQENRGRVAEAAGGTLFLDEIGTTNERFQIALLRVLENQAYRPVGGQDDKFTDARIIAATNLDLGDATQMGHFRDDLLHRLQVLQIELPPLRKRLEDLPALIAYFIGQLATEHGLEVHEVSDQAMDVMRSYPWPGNVRELKNVLSQAALVSEKNTIDGSHLPARLLENSAAPVTDTGHAEDEYSVTGPKPQEPSTELQWSGELAGGSSAFHIPVGITLRDLEREYTKRTLEYASHNKTQAAKILGISRKTLYDKLNRWDDTSEPVT